MSYRLQQSLSERPCVTRNLPSKRSEPTPPFSFSTTIHRYGETDCDFVGRRRRVTAHLEGVRYYGYRYYNPDLGRWINRDPIGEYAQRERMLELESLQYLVLLKGGVTHSSYVYVDNSTMNQFDPFGLFPFVGLPIDKLRDHQCRQCCPKEDGETTCERGCRLAGKSPFLKHAAGQVMCFRGLKCLCLWPDHFKHQPVNDKLMDCVRRHEKVHWDDTSYAACPKCDRDNCDMTTTRGEKDGSNYDDPKHECPAYRESIFCMARIPREERDLNWYDLWKQAWKYITNNCGGI